MDTLLTEIIGFLGTAGIALRRVAAAVYKDITGQPGATLHAATLS